MSTLHQKICTHVENSLNNKQYNEEFSFPIPLETVRRVKGTLYLDMSGYKCVIKSHDVRHVKKRHPSDIGYICEIPEILQNFNSAKKSITKDYKTGSSLINLEFYKKYNNNIVKLVKLRLHLEKRLELKTIFLKEEQ